MSGVFITAPQLHIAPCQDPEELQYFKWGLECIVFLCNVMFDEDGIFGGSRCFVNIFMNTSLYRNSIYMNTIESGNTAPLQGWLDSLSASPLSGSQICLCAHKHTILQVTMTLSSQDWMEARSITQMNILLQWNIVKREQLQLYAGPCSYIIAYTCSSFL